MMSLLQSFRFVVFMMCCMLLACGVEAQYDVHSVIANSDKLGLTPDQKTKIEAIQKDVQSQTISIMDNKTLPPSQWRAKRREIDSNESSRISDVLTPAQQQKLRDLLFPKNQWRVDGYIFPEKDLAHYNVRLDSYPQQKYLSYIIHRSDIRLSAFDAAGKPVPNGPQLTLASNVPDTIRPVTDKDDFDFLQMELVLDRKTAKSGYYKFRLTVPVEASDSQTHERIKIPDAHAESTPPVYLNPQPDAAPALAVGQRFIGTPWDEVSASTVTPYKNANTGELIKWREIVTKILTIERMESSGKGNKLTFALEGHSGQICIETDLPATSLPHLTPLLTEPNVRALKTAYEGKQVWCYGGAGVQCVTTEPGMQISMSAGRNIPLRIRHVARVWLPCKELAIGSATFIGGERQSAFVTDNPLVIILDAPSKGLEFSGFSYVQVGNAKDKGGHSSPEAMSKDMDDMLPKAVSNPRAHCLGLWNMVSDLWDFEREYSIQSPADIGCKWLAKMRKAVLSGRHIKGMTREMAAWVMGWPSMYGTKSQMLHESDWTYDNIPFPDHIYFKNGRMVSEDWPSLP